MDCRKSLGIGPRTGQDVLKGRTINKLNDGGDNFDDYWTDTDDSSSSVSNTSDELSTSYKTNRASNSILKFGHSIHTSQVVLSNVSNEIENEVTSVNKENCITGIEDKTLNLGVDQNNSESDTLNKDLDNIHGNNSISELSKITTAVTNEKQSIHNFESQTCNQKIEMPKLISKVSFKANKKSISRSTRKGPKLKEMLSHFDEYDEKIMQLVHMNDEDKNISIASEEGISLTEQSSLVENTSEAEKENVLYEDPSKRVNNSQLQKHSTNTFILEKKLTTKNSHNVYNLVNSLEDVSCSDMGRNPESCSKDVEAQTNKAVVVNKNFVPDNYANPSIHSPSKNSRKENKKIVNEKNDLDLHSSEPYCEDLSYLETNKSSTLIKNAPKTQTNKIAVNKDSMPDNNPNPSIDSPSKNTRKQNRNNNVTKKSDIDQHSSETSHELLSYLETDDKSSKSIHNATTKAQNNKISVNKDSMPDNNPNLSIDSPSKNTRKQNRNNNVTKEKYIDQHSSETSYEDLSYLETDKSSKSIHNATTKTQTKKIAVNKDSMPSNPNPSVDSPSKNTRKQNRNNNNVAGKKYIDQHSSETSYEDLSYLETDKSSKSIHNATTKTKTKKNAVNKDSMPSNPNPSVDSPSKNTRKQNRNNNNVTEKNYIDLHSAKISPEDLSYSDADKSSKSINNISETHTNKIAANKNSMPDNPNSSIDSPSKNTRRQNRNNNNVTEKNYIDLHSAKISTEDLSYSDADKSSKSISNNSEIAIDKNSVPDNYLNSPSKNIRRQIRNSKSVKEKNYQHPSKKIVLEKSLPISPEDNSPSRKRNLHDISENSFNNIAKISTKKTSKRQKVNNKSEQKNKKSIFLSDEDTVGKASSKDSSQLKISKRVNTRNNSITEKTGLGNTLMKYPIKSVNNISEANYRKPTIEKKKKIKYNTVSRKEGRNKKSDFISDKESIVETAHLNDLSSLQTSKVHKIRNNAVLEETDGVDNASEVNKKTVKKQKIMENKKVGSKAGTSKKSGFISDEDFYEAAGTNDLSSLQTSERRKTRNSAVTQRIGLANTSMYNPENSVDNVSEINVKKSIKKQRKFENKVRPKTRTTKKSTFTSEENISEVADFDDLSSISTSERENTENAIPVENDIANTSKNLTNNISGDIAQTNGRKKLNKKKIATKENSDFITNNVIETANLSQLQTSNSVGNISEDKTQRPVNNKNLKNNKSRRTTTNGKCNFIPEEDIIKTADLDDISRTSNQQQRSNNSITEGTEQNNVAGNSFEKSITSISKINIKKTRHKHRKYANDKSDLRDENSIEGQHLSNNTKVARKSKFSLQKNNLHNEETNIPLIRKSARNRYAPLASWRNERLLYRFQNGNIQIVGIESGTKEDDLHMQAISKRYIIQNMKKKKVPVPKKATVIDIVENKKKRVNLQTKYSITPWNAPVRSSKEENSKCSYMIKRMLETDSTSFGYIHIDVGERKPSQFLPEEDLQLTLIRGNVEVHIIEHFYTLETKDMFVVPRGSAYCIKNIGKKSALLSYAVGKFKYLDRF